MERKAWTSIDRAGWPKGPWDDEPEDKVQWTDEATQLPCIANRTDMGHWCGYVGVPPGHPMHGKDESEIDVDVHGGPTFADRCQEGDEARTVCHVPCPGEPADVWWIGFDCAHWDDQSPGLAARASRYGDALGSVWNRGVYRTLSYVEAQCASLAKQLKELSEVRQHSEATDVK